MIRHPHIKYICLELLVPLCFGLDSFWRHNWCFWTVTVSSRCWLHWGHFQILLPGSPVLYPGFSRGTALVPALQAQQGTVIVWSCAPGQTSMTGGLPHQSNFSLLQGATGCPQTMPGQPLRRPCVEAPHGNVYQNQKLHPVADPLGATS
jgi:hypothetical protein